ncbi:MAG: hypothetical protein BroJett011_42940 [Chloroflexota bacterium]|nr:MAG: hypothetical protein BroJett011_42940 [Chloroflexota bacterium]
MAQKQRGIDTSNEQQENTPYTHPQQAFVQSMEWRIPIQWFGIQGIHILDNDRVVTITLVARRVVDNYEGFQVEIVSKTVGTIAHYYFSFNIFLSPDQRIDKRDDYKGGFYVSPGINNDWRWYIAIPTSTRPLTQAIEQWIDLFRMTPHSNSQDQLPTPTL